MGKISLLLTIIGTTLLGMLAVEQAVAQSAYVFVSGGGADRGLCTWDKPCRTFQFAHDVVAAGGEIDVLDPASYGTLTITKAISIQGHGFSGSTGILINAGATDKINLRGLLIDGFGTATDGIIVGAVASLNIQDSVIRNFTVSGIYFNSAGPSQLNVSQTLVSDLGSKAFGVIVLPNGGSVNAVLDHVRLDQGFIGVAANGISGSVNLTIVDSVISNYNTYGITAQTNSGQSQVMVRNCTISNNRIGIETFGSNAVVRVTKSTISANAFGMQPDSGGAIVSFGDNNLAGNTTSDGAPTSTILLK